VSDLFSAERERKLSEAEPLAYRLRPRTLDEFVGQEHFIGPGKLLRRMLQADRLASVIFYGPPGTGKTSLARVIANTTSAQFEQLNAGGSGVREIREILKQAEQRLATEGRRTVLFVDELHRFNRAQQDVLLADVERGVVTLIGATTENPFFAINSPLISRSQIFQFEPLTDEHVLALLRRAVTDRERGYGGYDLLVDDDAFEHLAKTADGDARRALTGLEVAVLSQLKHAGKGRAIHITTAVATESIQRKALVYDRAGDAHYDHASAFIKSMRGSDPDAAVYWLARMLESGQDIRFIARRIAICAAEDVGNADPMALVVANAAVQIVEYIGLPEAQLPLSQAAIYIACAPKSNASAAAIWSAAEDVKNNRTVPVPVHLRDANYPGAKRLAHGKGYKYDHDAPDGVAEQDYLGVNKTYYQPTDRGKEAQIAKYLEMVRRRRQNVKEGDTDDASGSDG